MVPMKTHVSEFPKHPLPYIPQPEEQHCRMQPPTVVVYEKQGWEYEVVKENLAEGPPLTQEGLERHNLSGAPVECARSSLG
jgi:hypothetical protein